METSPNSIIRGPHRRAVAISFLSVAVAGLAYASLRQIWYVFSFSTPSMTVPGTFVKTGAIHANATYDAFGLTAAGTATGVHGPTAALGNIAGMPTPMVYLLGSAVLVLAAAALRSTVLALVGFVVANLARLGIDAMRAVVENPTFGGSYMFPTRGLAWFTFAFMAMMALSLLTAVQVVFINRTERAIRRARGEMFPSVFESITTLYTGAFSRLSRMNEAGAKEPSNV